MACETPWTRVVQDICKQKRTALAVRFCFINRNLWPGHYDPRAITASIWIVIIVGVVCGARATHIIYSKCDAIPSFANIAFTHSALPTALGSARGCAAGTVA